MIVAIIVAILVALNSFGQLFLKKAAIEKEKIYLILGYSLFVLSLVFVQVLLKYVEFNMLALVISLNVIGVYVVAAVYLNEKLTKSMVLGSILVAFGSVIFMQ